MRCQLTPNLIIPSDLSRRFDRSFNRMGNPQDIGNILNIQYLALDFPGQGKEYFMEGVAFPFHSSDSKLSGIFTGASYDTFDGNRAGFVLGLKSEVLGAPFDLSLDIGSDIRGSLSLSWQF